MPATNIDPVNTHIIRSCLSAHRNNKVGDIGVCTVLVGTPRADDLAVAAFVFIKMEITEMPEQAAGKRTTKKPIADVRFASRK